MTKQLLLGDGIALHTGFAQVLRHVASALVDRGDEVFQIAALDLPPTCDSRPYHDLGVTPFFPAGDAVGASVLEEVLSLVKPDAILLNMDPGSAWGWLDRLRERNLPTVLYAPIEGGPVHTLLAQSFRWATRACTYTAWSAAQLAEQHKLTVPWVYHGIDRTLFQPLSYWERTALRAALGWEGQFVSAYVARNNGRKGHDRLVKAMPHLDKRHHLYLHCTSWTNQLGGWDLGWLAEHWGVRPRIEFSPQTEEVKGLPGLDLAKRLAAADCYVTASQVEGFGLPLVEAMACGLPVIAPADRGNQQEVLADAAYVYVPVKDWDTWHTGAQLAATDPRHLAQAIDHCATHPANREEASRRSLDRAGQPCFSWAGMTDTLLSLLDRAVAEPKAPAGE